MCANWKARRRRRKGGWCMLNVSLCHNVIVRYAFLMCMHACHACVRVSCTCIVHARLGQRTGSTARLRERGGGRALATRLAPSGVCCHFSGEVPPTRCKRRRQQRRAGTVFTVCACVLERKGDRGGGSFMLQPCLVLLALPPTRVCVFSIQPRMCAALQSNTF